MPSSGLGGPRRAKAVTKCHDQTKMMASLECDPKADSGFAAFKLSDKLTGDTQKPGQIRLGQTHRLAASG